MMLMAESQPANELALALQEPEVFAKMGPGFALLEPGNWKGLVAWAASFGFSITLPHLYILCSANPAIFDQMAASSHLSGWNLESLKKAAEEV